MPCIDRFLDKICCFFEYHEWQFVAALCDGHVHAAKCRCCGKSRLQMSGV